MRVLLLPFLIILLIGCQPPKQKSAESKTQEGGAEVTTPEKKTVLEGFLAHFKKGDYQKAYRFIKEKASKKDGEALFWMGVYHREGFNVLPVDFKNAIQYFEESHKNGYLPGKVAAELTKANLGEIDGDEQLWVELLTLTRGYEPKGVVAYYQGVVMKKLKSYREAGDWLKAAILDYPPAVGMLYQFYHHGLLSDSKVEMELFKKLEKLAEGGVASAQLVLGVSYRNAPNGIKWLERCKKQGLISCYSVLGFNYINGKGVRTDRKQGYELLNEAAKMGDLKLKADLKKAGYLEE